MNEKTIQYAAYTFVVLAIFAKFSGVKKAPVKAAPAPQKKTSTAKKIGGVVGGLAKKFLGFDEAGQPIYALADEESVV